MDVFVGTRKLRVPLHFFLYHALHESLYVRVCRFCCLIYKYYCCPCSCKFVRFSIRRIPSYHTLYHGVTKRCRLFLADQQRPRNTSPNAREGRVTRPLPMNTAVLYTGAQINFGDLTPYLTYALHPPLRSLCRYAYVRCNALVYIFYFQFIFNNVLKFM